jgi:hypothetical protein
MEKPRRTLVRRFTSPVAVLLPFVLSSCFTLGLWGFAPEDDADPATGCESYSYDPETPWSWGLLGLRVLLTPLTLCLDCLTAPLQCCSDDHEDHRHSHRRCACR